MVFYLLSHLMFMAHDGFSMNCTLEALNGGIVRADRVETIVKRLCDLHYFNVLSWCREPGNKSINTGGLQVKISYTWQ